MLANVLTGLVLWHGYGYGAKPPPYASLQNSLAPLERQNGGRLGAFVSLSRRTTAGYREDERFLMCSTFKIILVAAILARVDAGRENLSSFVPYGMSDILDYAPITTEHVGEGKMSLRDLCRAAIEVSDNTAANLLLKRLGGPRAVTEFARSCGDKVTRLDRNEPTLNRPNGILDTTTPRAMAGTVQKILFSHRLKARSRDLLLGWMQSCKTGLQSVRGVLPSSWQPGDKSGSGRTANNDVVVAFPPHRSFVILATFYDAPSLTSDQRQSVLRATGRLVTHYLTNGQLRSRHR